MFPQPDEEELLELDDELEELDDEEPELLEDEELEELLELEDDEPFKMSAPSCGLDINEEPSILVPGEYFPTAFKNLSCAASGLKLRSPTLFKEIPCKLRLSNDT